MPCHFNDSLIIAEDLTNKIDTIIKESYDRGREDGKSDLMDALDEIRTKIMDTGAYEQEVHGETEFLKGINYCLGVLDKYMKESEDKE